MSIFIPKTQKASTSSIADLEKRVGRKLPKSYLAFLSEYDGAKPEENVFNVGEGNTAGIDEFIPATEILRIRDIVEGFPSHALPIARATAGNFVYLDPTNDAVFFWNHEIDAADIKLADSFDDFLETLRRFDIDQIKLKPGQVKRVWINPNFKPKF